MPHSASGGTPAERRRLARILADENLGPKLVRLDRRGQRSVLDLISANRGREARTEINRLDEQRVNAEHERERQRRLPRALAILLRYHKPGTLGQANRIRTNAEGFTVAQLRAIEKRSQSNTLRGWLEDHAQPGPPKGKIANPFWYR